MKYVIIGLTVIAAICAGLFLWERNTVVKQAGQISALQVENTGLLGQLQAAQKNIEAQKKLVVQYQKAANDAAALMAEVNNIKGTLTLGDGDAKTICSVTDYFNNAGVLQPVPSGSAEASGQILPTANKANSCGTGWTVEMIVANYLKVISYALQLEKMGACYEFPQ
jgi:hypothetical protein